MPRDKDAREDVLKHHKPKNEQIKAVERELAILDAKREVLQDRIRQHKGVNQSIADEQVRLTGYRNQK
jgi:hypothetical protein